MKIRLGALIILMATIPITAVAKQEAAIDPGPPPASIEEFQRLAIPALLRGFYDPSSAQITWDRGITGGYWKPPLSKKIPGWFTCGLVNAKNRMGGYVGARRFVVVQNNGQVVYAATGDGGNFDFIQLGCDKAIKEGLLPLASAISLPATVIPMPTSGIGIQISTVPDGAYVVATKPNGPAARAGITAGMVISHVNSVAIKGIDSVIVAKMIQGTESPVKLTIIGKGDMSLTNPSYS